MVHSILKAPTQPTGIISLFHGEILKGKKKMKEEWHWWHGHLNGLPSSVCF